MEFNQEHFANMIKQQSVLLKQAWIKKDVTGRVK